MKLSGKETIISGFTRTYSNFQLSTQKVLEKKFIIMFGKTLKISYKNMQSKIDFFFFLNRFKKKKKSIFDWIHYFVP